MSLLGTKANVVGVLLAFACGLLQVSFIDIRKMKAFLNPVICSIHGKEKMRGQITIYI